MSSDGREQAQGIGGRLPTCLTCALRLRPSDCALKVSRVGAGATTGTTDAAAEAMMEGVVEAPEGGRGVRERGIDSGTEGGFMDRMGNRRRLLRPSEPLPTKGRKVGAAALSRWFAMALLQVPGPGPEE